MDYLEGIIKATKRRNEYEAYKMLGKSLVTNSNHGEKE